jgi:cupin 2 domain-containing protein
MPQSAVLPRPENLFAPLVVPSTGEDVETLLASGCVRIERIASSSHPKPTLYDQDGDEWVLLLQGESTLELNGIPVSLRAGDHLTIPAHLPHRVLATSDDPHCIWLAVHLLPQAEATGAT